MLRDESHRNRLVSALRGYDIVQICTAFKLLVANEFVLYANREVFEEKVGEEKFMKGLAWYESGPLNVVGPNFVADDQADVALLPESAFEFDDPRFLSQETASSFAKYCRSVGADDPHYWQKIYTRLGLEYTSTSPPGNLAVPPWDLSPAALKQRREPVEAACTWHPVLRWFLFLPAGCVGCVLAILCLRYLYWFVGEGWFGENAFWWSML